MKPERWQQIERLYHAALERAPAQRAAFLDQACAGDESLRREVESLLASNEQAGSFLAAPALEDVARAIAEEQAISLVGRKVGHYQILSLLGAGGMGKVYLARDTKLGRQIALKLLPKEFTQDRERVRRFEQEARAASALNHPNIITIHEIGQAEDLHFIATEFIDGETLRQRMMSGGMKLREALDAAIQVASALAAAHAAGIVHRDIKPENIMLRRDGYVKVLDFGLAKLIERFPVEHPPIAGDDAPTRGITSTDPGKVMGTPRYMSPEQVLGRQTDGRSDIFSLGVVLYEMVAGRAPFEGTTPGEMLAAILNQEPPPLARYSRETPAELERIVNKALQKDREERYQVVKDLLIDLKNLRLELEVEAKLKRAASSDLKEEATDTPGREPMIEAAEESATSTEEIGAARSTSSAEYLISEIKRHKRGVAVALAILLIVTAGIGFGVYKLISQSQSKPIAPLQTMKITRLTTSGKVRDAAISPDGKYVAYAVDNAGQWSLWVRQVATSSSMQIVPPAAATYLSALTFSHDGSHIYYIKSEAVDTRILRTAGLYQVPALGGISRKLTGDINLARVTFSPDGKRLAFGRHGSGETALMVANADGTGEQKLHTRKSPDTLSGLAWSPDGKTIACIAGNPENYTYNVVEVRVESGAERPITSQRWYVILGLAWLSDGSGLVMTASDQPSAPSQIWHLSYPGGEAQRVTNDLNQHGSVSLTADSNTLLTVQGEKLQSIWIAPNGDVSRAKQITPGAGRDDHPSWTPDGKLVYASQASGSWDIWTMAPDGGNQKQLTVNAGANKYPSVSPDGRYIVFVSDRTGGSHIWRMDIDGGNLKQLTSGKSNASGRPLCSSDGKWVVYTSSAADEWTSTLWKVPIDGGDPVQLTDKHSASPAISPDGKRIACYYRDGLNSEGIALIPLEGGSPARIFHIRRPRVYPLDLRWRPDGSALTYIDTRGSSSNIWSQPLASGSPIPLTDFKAGEIYFFDWSRDGKQLAFSRRTTTSDVVLISGFK